jgi:hypothetical protein
LERLLVEKTPVECFPEYDPMKVMLFRNRASLKTILNISEMLICTDPNSMNEAMYWFYTALKGYQRYDPANLHKCKISLAIFAIARRDLVEAEKLLISVSNDLKGSDNPLLISALERHGKMLLRHFPQREKEA